MNKVLVLILTLITNYAVSQQTVGVFYNTPEAFNGYTMIAPVTSDSVYLVDNCGYQVHKWATQGLPGFAAYLLENGDLLRTGRISSSIFFGGGSGGVVQKYSWDGELLWDFQVSDLTIHQHHDVEPMPNGNVLVLSWGYASNSDAILNGRIPSTLNDELWPTVIQEIEPIYPNGGNVVWEWTVWDHLVQEFDATKLNYGVVADHHELLDINYSSVGVADFLHCNAVNYNAEHDLVVMSSRRSSEIYVIDHSTTTTEASSHSGGIRGKGGDILYRWGNPQVYDRGDPDDQILIGPHDIHWIADSLVEGGKFMVFNNIGGEDGSAVNIFTPPMDDNGDFPDPGAEAFGPEGADWHYEEPEFSSSTVSGAQRLPNGNTLVCEGASGHLFELTPEDDKVWEYVNPSSVSGNYSQGVNPSQNGLFRAYRYPVNFPAFIGENLSPGGLIEIDPDPFPCDISQEPVGVSSYQDVLDVKVISYDGRLRIVGDIQSQGAMATIYDLKGCVQSSTILSGTHSEIDISNLSKGLYILELSSENAHRTLKFINK